MLFEIFGALMILSLILVGLGYYVDVPVFSTIGFFFLFLLALSLQGGGVTSTSSINESYSYVCGCCENNTFKTTSTRICEGTPRTCDYYDLDEMNCLLAGCNYNETLCSGTPTPCSNLPIANCLYYGCQESVSQCVNTSDVVVDKKIITNNQEALSDQNTVWIGRFLAIASALGFIIVLAQFRRGKVDQ